MQLYVLSFNIFIASFLKHVTQLICYLTIISVSLNLGHIIGFESVKEVLGSKTTFSDMSNVSYINNKSMPIAISSVLMDITIVLSMIRVLYEIIITIAGMFSKCIMDT